jgi:hypothetical protein
MADYGVAVTWGAAKTGREKKALELWADTITINDKAVANGQIDSWDVVVFEPSATPPSGVTRLYGSQDQIETYIRSDDFQDAIERATLLLNDVGMRRFMTGAGLADAFARYTKLVESL